MTFRLICVVVPLSASFVFAGSPAEGDVTKAQCVDANRQSQSLRRDGKFAEAREQLLMCANPKCPALVHSDCNSRLDELEAAQPAIVFDAKDGSGHDLGAVIVTMDGRPLTTTLDGTALPVDPGKHEFTFTVSGQPAITKTFVISEGQKRRHEAIVIPLPAPPPPPPPEQKSVEPRVEKDKREVRNVEGGGKKEEGLGTQRVIALAAGGLGIAGVVVGSIFGEIASSNWSKAQSDCGSGCSPSAPAQGEKSDALTSATVSTVGFIVGGVALAAGAVLWLTAPPAGKGEASSARVRLVPSVSSRTGGMLVQGEF